MKPEEYLTYFEDFIFVANKESGQKNPFSGTRCGIVWYYTTHGPQDQV